MEVILLLFDIVLTHKKENGSEYQMVHCQ